MPLSPSESAPLYVEMMGGQTTFDDLINEGKVKLEGDRQPFEQLKSLLVQFSPDFEIMLGTKPVQPTTQTQDPFAQSNPADTSGG